MANDFGFSGSETHVTMWQRFFVAKVIAVELDAGAQTASFTATTTDMSSTLTGVSPLTGIQLGMVVSGIGIPTDTTIIDINVSGATVTLSAAATASGPSTLTGAMYLYSWQEETYSTVTAAVLDLAGLRVGGPSFYVSKIQAAYELNNRLLEVPFYTHMRHRSSPGGNLMFEFSAASIPPEESVEITLVTEVCGRIA